MTDVTGNGASADRISDLRGELRESISDLRGELRDVDARLRGELHDMDTRLHGELHDMDARLRGVEQGQAAMSAKLDLLIDSIVSKLPSWWQMPAVIGATVTLLVALYEGAGYLHSHGGWP